MTGSDAQVHIFQHYQSYALLQAFLAGVADITFTSFTVTYGTTTDAFLLKNGANSVGTFTVTYSSTARDIVSTAVYVAA